MHRVQKTLRIICALLLLSNPLIAHSNTFIKHGFIEINLYPYQTKVDSDSSLTVNAFARLPNRFSYFSLTNFRDPQGENWSPELSAFYTEQNLRWQIAEQSAFELTFQSNFRQGANNDRHRLGILWRLNKTPLFKDFFKSINLSYFVNWHVIQFDHEEPYIWQMEHVFLITFPSISDRLYLGGFIDHTFNQDLPSDIPSNPMLGEAQLGYNLVDNLFAVTEYRVNQYRRSNVNNIAFGLEYKLKW